MTDFVVPKLPLSAQEIIRKAALEFRRYAVFNKNVFELGMSFDSMYEEYIYPTYEIGLKYEDLGFDEAGQRILGTFLPVEKIAKIDSSLRKSPQRVFTLFHEVCGHGILQGDWLRKNMARLQHGRVASVEHTPDFTYDHGLEWQANLFAAHLAAPTQLITEFATKKLKLNRTVEFKGPGFYGVETVDGYREFRCQTFDAILTMLALPLQRYFGHLSVQSLAIRLGECGVAVDRAPKPRTSNGINRVAKQLATSIGLGFK